MPDKYSDIKKNILKYAIEDEDIKAIVLKIAFFATVGYFVVKSGYIIVNYLTHPEKYIYSSFPWYTEILVTGICCGGIALILGVLLFVIHKKMKKIEE